MGYSFRFAHTADTHLGLNWPVIPAREDAQIPAYGSAFEFIIEKAREKDVDFILHAGDLVEHPRPTIPALRRSFSELRKLKRDNIPFIITKGTHDSSQEYFEKFGGDFLVVLEEEGKVIYVERSRKGREFCDLKLDGKTVVRIYGLGEYGSEQRTILSDFSSSFTKRGANFTILLMHSGLVDRPYTLGAVLSTADLRALCGVIDYFALGHDHQHFEDRENAIFNPGSPEFCSFKEASTIIYSFKNNDLKEKRQEVREKGFYIVEVEDGKIDAEFIKIPTRKIFNVQVEFDKATPDEIFNGMSEALERNTKPNKNIILRPIITGTLAPNYHVYDLKLKEIQESVSALYVDWPLCLIEGVSFERLEVSPERSYHPLFQSYFEKKGWDKNSSKNIARFVVDIVKGLNPSAESEETREEAKRSVLKMIEEFNLDEVKKS
ncbi:MAG: metallophosphoesterase family protein [Nitrososphaerales archaeon]